MVHGKANGPMYFDAIESDTPVNVVSLWPWPEQSYRCKDLRLSSATQPGTRVVLQSLTSMSIWQFPVLITCETANWLTDLDPFLSIGI